MGQNININNAKYEMWLAGHSNENFREVQRISEFDKIQTNALLFGRHAKCISIRTEERLDPKIPFGLILPDMIQFDLNFQITEKMSKNILGKICSAALYSRSKNSKQKYFF